MTSNNKALTNGKEYCSNYNIIKGSLIIPKPCIKNSQIKQQL